MSFADTAEPMIADPHTTRTFGMLNIIYALMLLAGGLCSSLWCLSPAIFSYVLLQVEESTAKKEETRKSQIADLVEKEKIAPDEATKTEIVAEREAIESQIDTNPFKGTILTDATFRDPRFMAHFGFDLLSGLLLNLLMLISGIGLYRLSGWGRILAILVAWAKILRLIVLAASMTILVAPIVTDWLTKLEAVMPADGAQPAGLRLATLLTVNTWIFAAIGSIYPVLTIVWLGRPSIVEAIRESKERDFS